MKVIIFLLFGCLFSSVLLSHDAFYTQQYTEDRGDCSDYFIGKYMAQNKTYSSEDGTQSLYDDVVSKSDCVDLYLGDENLRGAPYYDHCCYVRAQKEGTFYHGCIGLKEAEYLDIKETIDEIEKGRHRKYMMLENSKIYELLCSSSYINAGLIALLALLF